LARYILYGMVYIIGGSRAGKGDRAENECMKSVGISGANDRLGERRFRGLATDM
jgi:hypothetical protein